MSLGLVFWILMLIWLVFGWIGDRVLPGYPWASNLLLFILLLLLGWAQFGAPIQG